MVHNPVMFVVEVGAVLTTLSAIKDPSVFAWVITVWLWLTAVFANLAEAVAEGRGKAQAETLRRTKTDDRWPAVSPAGGRARPTPQRRRFRRSSCASAITSWSRPGRSSPATAMSSRASPSVDESAITGESAPVIRESGGDRSAVTGGTKVLSDRIVVRITSKPGETFIDRMIALVEGAARQKTPNEIALNILLASLTIVFLIAVVTLQPFAIFAGPSRPSSSWSPSWWR